MLSFPLSYLLIPYALFLAVFIIFAGMHFVHLGKFGASGITSFVIAFVFLAGTAIIVYWSWYFIKDINWQTLVVIKLPSLNTLPTLQ